MGTVCVYHISKVLSTTPAVTALEHEGHSRSSRANLKETPEDQTGGGGVAGRHSKSEYGGGCILEEGGQWERR